MTDKNGKSVSVGDRVSFKSGMHEGWLGGTVRRFRLMTYYNDFEQRLDVQEAWVDNGEPSNIDGNTNGFTCAAWVDSSWVEVLP